jgi:tRNA A37 threonylcarbamoyladenosine dehydratase
MDSYNARFNGVGRLYSPEGLQRLRDSHVCVIGLGGVGSWAVEALARSGIGKLTLVDLDDVCIGNVNRQLHALNGEWGKPKVEVMARRVLAINPDCAVHPLQSFFLKSTAEDIFKTNFDFVLDAIDSPARKCQLISLCREKSIPIITTGASAGRRDPTAVQVCDLAFSSHDRLLQEVRKKLRVKFGFPRKQQPFGVECVRSSETVPFPQFGNCEPAAEPDLRLDCSSGYGTATFVTGTFGFIAAARIIQKIADGAICSTPRDVRTSTVPVRPPALTR